MKTDNEDADRPRSDGRVAVPDRVKRQVWVRSGGRCALCGTYLLEDHLSDPEVMPAIGEVAHIAPDAPGGPRQGSAVDRSDRSKVENLLLLCPNDHRSADNRLSEDLYTEEFLVRRKADWEAFVKHATDLGPDATTIVVRMTGGIHGAPGDVTKRAAADAVMAHSARLPMYLPDPAGVGLDIDLRNIPEPVDDGYWKAAVRQIRAAADRIRRAIGDGDVSHISVFAISYVPLLVALGNSLDDTVPLDIYERHRSSDSWRWNEDAPIVPFGYTLPSSTAPDEVEAVLIVNASGTVDPASLPDDVVRLARCVIEPADGSTPGLTSFDHPDTLRSFTETVSSCFSALERDHRQVRTVHLFAAVPVSAAVTIGSRLPIDVAAPALATYHLTNGRYERAIDIPTSPKDQP